MALRLDEVRTLAERVAASHGLDVVEVEYLGGGGKHRTLRVFIEKNSEERAKLRERVERWRARHGAAAQSGPRNEPQSELKGEQQSEGSGPEIEGSDPQAQSSNSQAGEPGLALRDADLEQLPEVENLELLSGITHEDCEEFSRDFGVVLEVEELAPGTEYVLEVSSPGLDRKLHGEAEFRRFAGALAKLQTFEPVAGNRHWQGRIGAVDGQGLHLAPVGGQKARKARKGAEAPAQPGEVAIAFSNIEKAQLVPEF